MIADALKKLAVPIDTLTPDPRNARTHPARNLEALRTSLRHYGQRKPLVVRKADRRIIAGNGLWQAAKDLGWKEIAVVMVEDDDATATGYALMDNQSALLSEWDFDRLGELALELKSADFDLDLTGFDLDDLAEFTGETIEPKDAEPQIDRAEELRKEWGVEYGDLWQLGRHRLLCGDSTKAADVGRVLGDRKPVLMVTDPPYGVEYDADWRNQAKRPDGTPYGAFGVGKVSNDDRSDWREAWALFPGDVAYVWHGERQCVDLARQLQDSGFENRNLIAWAKSGMVIGRGHYHSQHETCWYAVRKNATSKWAGDHSQTTLWEIDKPQKSETGHSTQKPLECMARPIRNHDAPEVYDPFLGSGTTMVAAEQLGRTCYAVEIDPGYVAVCLQRYQDVTGETPVLLERA